MIPDIENRWWNVFIPREASQDTDICPALPMNESRAWHKGLVDLYCPCRSDSADAECQLLLT
nr:hypothetical protein [uncultured Desulfobacter sp.]